MKKKNSNVSANAGKSKKKISFRELVGDELVFHEDSEFRDYLPPLSEIEFEALEEVMVRDNIVKDHLVVWQGKLLDGYSRFDIARKYNLSYKVVELQVETKEEALVWLVEHHVARRHLSLFAIIEAYLKLKPMYAKIAKKNQGRKDGNFEPINSLKKIAGKVECGKTYVYMAEKILNSKQPKLIQDCRTGKKTIRTGYFAVNGNTPPPPNPSPKAFDNPKVKHWKNRAVSGDVLDMMRELNTVFAGTIPLILTSIPFNVGLDYGNANNDSKDYYKEFLPWLEECVKEFAKAVMQGGRIVIECDSIRDEECKEGGAFRRNIFADLCKIVERVAPEMSFLGDIVWYKYNPKHFTATGTQLSCRAPRIARNHSYILIWSKGEDHVLEHYDVSRSDIEESEWQEMVNSVYADIPAEKDGMRKYGHPAVWPVKLCDRLIRLLTYPDTKNIVLDPFGGVGSTSVAAYLCGRSYISIDQNPDFTRKALERLDEAKAELAKKNNPKARKTKCVEIE